MAEDTTGIAKSAMTSLGTLGLGLLADSISAGGSVAVEALSVALISAVAAREERGRQRLREFHLHLLSPMTDEEREELLGQQFAVEDYYVILKCAEDDEERDKMRHYAALLRFLITHDCDGHLRSHLLRSFRGMTVADFDFLETICEMTRSPARSPDRMSPDHQIQRLVRDSDPLRGASIQALISWAYLQTGVRDGIPWPTKLASTVSEILEYPSPLGVY